MNTFEIILDELKKSGHKYVTNQYGFGMGVAEFKTVYADEDAYVLDIERQDNLTLITTEVGTFKTF